MASKCANCGARLSCGCQRRSSTNGTSACSGCVNTLNAKIAAEQSAAQQIAQTPTTVESVWGSNRYIKE